MFKNQNDGSTFQHMPVTFTNANCVHKPQSILQKAGDYRNSIKYQIFYAQSECGEEEPIFSSSYVSDKSNMPSTLPSKLFPSLPPPLSLKQ